MIPHQDCAGDTPPGPTNVTLTAAAPGPGRNGCPLGPGRANEQPLRWPCSRTLATVTVTSSSVLAVQLEQQHRAQALALNDLEPASEPLTHCMVRALAG